MTKEIAYDYYLSWNKSSIPKRFSSSRTSGGSSLACICAFSSLLASLYVVIVYQLTFEIHVRDESIVDWERPGGEENRNRLIKQTNMTVEWSSCTRKAKEEKVLQLHKENSFKMCAPRDRNGMKIILNKCFRLRSSVRSSWPHSNWTQNKREKVFSTYLFGNTCRQIFSNTRRW